MSVETVTRYHLALRILHWVVAVFVLLQLFVGEFALSELENNAEKIGPLAGHAAVGMSVGALMVLRLIIRFTTKKPPPAAVGNVVFDWLRRLTHFLMYFVVLSMVSTGVGTVLAAKLFPVLFGPGGTLPEDFDAFPPFAGHEFFAKALFVLLLLHVAGALYHQFVLKDNLISRMGFGKQKQGV